MKSVDVMRCSLVREAGIEYDKIKVETPEDVIEFFKAVGFENFADETFSVLCLDTKGRIAGYHEISHGDLSSTIVHPREVYKRALLNNAFGIVACHNHPSGDPTPSKEDEELTRRLGEAGTLLGVKMFDHIIIGNGETYSFKEEMPDALGW